MPPTRPLDFDEIRVLGALMEKEQTTPDHYPMTINALVSACNQKTNRDPVTQLSETQVVEALDRLRLDVLTWRSDGARVERWEHRLSSRWQLAAPRKAIMTLLLLRGPQTPGELKSRSERMHHFDSVDEVLSVLGEMAGQHEGALVRELPRQPGKRETRWTHIVGDEAYETEARAALEAESAADSGSARESGPRGPSSMQRIEALESAVESLGSTVEGLVEGVASLERELHALRVRLGDLD